jgi:hypothetical protein
VVELSSGGRVKLKVDRHHNEENNTPTSCLRNERMQIKKSVHAARRNDGTEGERDLRSYGMHE